MIKKIFKPNIIYLALFVTLLILPFSFSDRSDEIKAVEMNTENIGYYQSTTCKISLTEFILKNIETNEKIYFNNNNYVDVSCFGKITGVDYVSGTTIVSIGTNTSINQIIQSAFWLLIILFIPKNKQHMLNFSKFIFFIPLLFTFQIFAENRFYEKSNSIFNDTISYTNLYLIGNLIFYLLLTILIWDTLNLRYKNLVNYLPFIFLVIGTYAGMNLNFFLILLSVFGVISISKKKKLNRFDFIYFIFSFFWISSVENNDYFFDGDKIVGLNNTVYTPYSQIFWILSIYLAIKGAIFIFSESKNNINVKTFSKSSLFSGSLILSFGYLGSKFPIINFMNFYIFGQNKRGMKEFSSIEGNTWRGFSSSAESIGEFYGVVLLILFIILFNKMDSINFTYLLAIPIVYGLYRSNNFAAFISLLAFIFYLFLTNSEIYSQNKKIVKYLLLLLFIVFLIIIYFSYDYQYASTELIFEATLHHDFYTDSNDYRTFKKIEQKMIERDLNSILLVEENYINASSTYKFLVKIFTQDINVPYIPNIVAIISFVSLLINRTEMWGIFIAKYNPDFFGALFGLGPMQLNDYLYGHNIKLDVPKNELTSLFLPHSSVLSFIVFFGLLGLSIFLYNFVLLCFNKNKNTLYFVPSLYLVINFLKSDSLLYLNSLVFFIFLLVMSTYKKEFEN
tara:strand:- start:423 stop:2453 length:2031 start_codon:yes stop_codon:yes gene_type:complete